MTRVTVCIPIYNRSQALRNTVDSVLAQSFPDWELLLIDDGSTDDTPEVAQTYTSDPRVSYVRKPNGGHSSARNAGLQLARGEYIAFLDHDDVWMSDKLKLQVERLDEEPEIGLVYVRLRTIDENSTDLGPGGGPYPSGWVFKNLLYDGNFVVTMSSPMMRTTILRKVGGFHSGADTADDWDLLMRLARETQFGFIDKDLIHYNVGVADQQTRQHHRVIPAHWRCVEKYASCNYGLSRSERTAVWRAWDRKPFFGPQTRAWHALNTGDYRTAWRYYLISIRLRPSRVCESQTMKDLLSLSKRSLLALAGRKSVEAATRSSASAQAS